MVWYWLLIPDWVRLIDIGDNLMISAHIARYLGALSVAFVLWALSLTSAVADPDCTCRYSGQEVDLNKCVCMITPNGIRRACCGLVLNNTSWTFFKDGCVIAGSKMPDQSTRPAAAVSYPAGRDEG